MQENYIKNKKQVLVYQWGVWITAWARHELFKGILEINEDVIYCDTDSIKFLNYEKYENWINEYNKNCIDEINNALKYYEIDFGSGAKEHTLFEKSQELATNFWECDFNEK